MSSDQQFEVSAPPPLPLGRVGRFRAGLGPSGLLALLVLAGLGAAQNFDSAAFGVLAPEIRHTFHLNNAGIDTVSGLTGAVPLLLSVVIGNLGDRGDRVRISWYSALLWGVTAILTGLAPVLAVLVIARLLGGIGLLSSGTIYPSLLSDYYPQEKRAQVFTVFLLASTTVGLVASPLAGLLGDTFGWRSTFVVLALPTFVFAALLRLLHEPGRRAPSGTNPDAATDAATDAANDASNAASHAGIDSPTDAGTDIPALAGSDADGGADVVFVDLVGSTESAVPIPSLQAGNIRQSFRIIRSIRTLRRTWLGAFILGGASAPLSTLVSTYFKDVFHVGSFGRGAIISGVGIGGLIGLMLSGMMAQRMMAQGRGRNLPVITGVSAAVFAFFVLIVAVAPTLWLAVVACSFAGVGLGGFFPPYTTIVSMVTPSHLRSQAYAWSTVFLALGAIAVAAFVGTLADAAGQRTALGVLAPVIILGGMVLASTRRFVDADTVETDPAQPTGPGVAGFFG